jgi:hypothetical protein
VCWGGGGCWGGGERVMTAVAVSGLIEVCLCAEGGARMLPAAWWDPPSMHACNTAGKDCTAQVRSANCAVRWADSVFQSGADNRAVLCCAVLCCAVLGDFVSSWAGG